jgi:hypothetical protein
LQTRQNSEQLRSNEENTRRIEVAQLLFEAFDLMGADQGVVLGEIRRMPKERNDLQLAIRKIEQALILDEFVDSALAAEGLPILCVPARSGFSAQELAGASRRELSA